MDTQYQLPTRQQIRHTIHKVLRTLEAGLPDPSVVSTHRDDVKAMVLLELNPPPFGDAFIQVSKQIDDYFDNTKKMGDKSVIKHTTFWYVRRRPNK